MKNYIYLILVLAGVFTSCKGLVEGLNDDPNNFTDTPLDLIVNHSLLNVVAVAEAEMSRTANIFTDQFTGVDRQYGTLNVYSTLASNYDSPWEDIYQRGITQIQIAKEKAISANSAQFEGISLILEAYHFAEAALLFGDVPMTEVNQVDEFPDPAYDAQATVINSAIAMLNDGGGKADAISAANNIFSTSSSYDQIAAALKARYHLALGNYDAAYNAAMDAEFTSKDNDWNIIHGAANFAENLYWQFEVEQRQDYLRVDSSYMWRMLSQWKKFS